MELRIPAAEQHHFVTGGPVIDPVGGPDTYGNTDRLGAPGNGGHGEYMQYGFGRLSAKCDGSPHEILHVDKIVDVFAGFDDRTGIGIAQVADLYRREIFLQNARDREGQYGVANAVGTADDDIRWYLLQYLLCEPVF